MGNDRKQNGTAGQTHENIKFPKLPILSVSPRPLELHSLVYINHDHFHNVQSSKVKKNQLILKAGGKEIKINTGKGTKTGHNEKTGWDTL